VVVWRCVGGCVCGGGGGKRLGVSATFVSLLVFSFR